MPNIDGLGANDYLKTPELAKRGYAAAEAHKDELLQYALSPADWDAYIAHRRSKERGPAGNIMLVKVKAPTQSVTDFVNRQFAPLVNQPLDTDKIDKLLAEVRSDGRYDADYNGRLRLQERLPPHLARHGIGQKDRAAVPRSRLQHRCANGRRDARNRQTAFCSIKTSATTAQSSASKWTSALKRSLKPSTTASWIPPASSPLRASTSRAYRTTSTTARRIAFRSGNRSSRASVAMWVGETAIARSCAPAGSLRTYSGPPPPALTACPTTAATRNAARVRYVIDTQDRALVPGYGFRSVSEAAYLYATPGSPSTPQFSSDFEFAHTFAKKNIFLARAEGATMLNNDVAQPFRYTLGGPLRLSASAIDQYRGTDYYLFTPGYLRRIAQLPQPFGSSIYVGGSFEMGQMRSPDGPNITREDVYFGVVAETPIGVVTFAPAFGNAGERKFTFTIGKLF